MDFARKQLEKFGWKDGEGLGKTNQGIAVAIKPHLKAGKEGMGYDMSQELTDTWWTKAYSDSLSRINVASEDGEEIALKIIEDDDNKIDNSNSKKSKRKKMTDYTEKLRPMDKMRRRMMKANFTSFSKGGTLNNGEMSQEDRLDSDEDNNSKTLAHPTPIFKNLTDEELLKACGGRTAHKAARFGLKLNGKLARIAAQEQEEITAQVESCEPKRKKKKKSKNKTRSDS